MTIFYFFGVLSILFGIYAAFVRTLKHAALAIWLCGLSVGGIYLSLGAEFLAIIQVLLSTLMGISFAFYAVQFGPKEEKSHWLRLGLPLVLGAALMGVISLGALKIPVLPMNGQEGVFDDGILVLGRRLVEDHLISLEVVSLMLFLTLIGIGVIARAEVKK